MLRKAFSLLLSLLMLSGCAVKLPPRVDYTIGEDAKPDIEQPDDKLLTQVLFEIKIDEIKVKTQQFIVSDSIETIFLTRADSLLAGQQRYFLKNENIPNKTAKSTGKTAATYFIGLFAGVGIIGILGGEGAVYGLSALFTGIVASPIIYGDFWLFGGATGLLFHGKTIKPHYKHDLHKLISDYNEAVKDQLK